MVHFHTSKKYEQEVKQRGRRDTKPQELRKTVKKIPPLNTVAKMNRNSGKKEPEQIFL